MTKLSEREILLDYLKEMTISRTRWRMAALAGWGVEVWALLTMWVTK